MSTTEAALENLRIIRSLMEKAHIYRAVSAPAALTGGLLALAASAWPVQHALATNGGQFDVPRNTFLISGSPFCSSPRP
jgi:hypothetical protein